MRLRVFFSHSFVDEHAGAFARFLQLIRALDLEAVDLRQRPPTGGISESIKSEIDGCDALVALITADDRGASTYVIDEIRHALARAIPVAIFGDSSLPPTVLGQLQHTQLMVPVDLTSLTHDISHVVYHLAQLVRQARIEDQTVRKLEVTVRRSGDIPNTIEVCELVRRPDLRLTSATFFKGLQILERQINRAVPALDFALIVGVNSAGSIAANYLDGRLRRDRRPVAIIKTGALDAQRKRKLFYWNLPDELGDSPHILIVDGQIKSGHSTRLVRDLLAARYGDKALYNAYLVACGIAPGIDEARPVDIEKLFQHGSNSFFRADRDCLPHFLALLASATIQHPGPLR